MKFFLMNMKSSGKSKLVQNFIRRTLYKKSIFETFNFQKNEKGINCREILNVLYCLFNVKLGVTLKILTHSPFFPLPCLKCPKYCPLFTFFQNFEHNLTISKYRQHRQ